MRKMERGGDLVIGSDRTKIADMETIQLSNKKVNVI